LLALHFPEFFHGFLESFTRRGAKGFGRFT
jgi:hypothetical protein